MTRCTHPAVEVDCTAAGRVDTAAGGLFDPRCPAAVRQPLDVLI